MQPLAAGDKVFLRTHTGKLVSVGYPEDSTIVHASWENRGEWEKLTIETTSKSPVPLQANDKLRLLAYNGKLISCGTLSDNTVIHASWSNRAAWENFKIEKDGGGPVYPGDTVRLEAHTGRMLTAGDGMDDSVVHARWGNRGAWEAFVIELAERAPSSAPSAPAPPDEEDEQTQVPHRTPAQPVCPYASPLPECSVPSGTGGEWVVATSCALPSGSYDLRKIRVSSNTVLVVQQGATVDLALSGGMLLEPEAQLWIGCEGEPFTGRMTTTFKGGMALQGNPDHTFIIDYAQSGLPARTETYSNGLFVQHGAHFESHGMQATSWTRLAGDAEAGSSVLRLEHSPTGWSVGDEIVVAATSTDAEESELATIASVSGREVRLTRPLLHSHIGHWQGRGARLNAEVALLSHNIVFTSTVDESKCRGLLEAADVAAKTECFGGQLVFLQHTVARVENTEFHKMGQGMVMGRYPLHFHLAGDVRGSYLRGNSVHRGLNRCITLHAALHSLVEGNVCFDSHGHNIYLEDGIEVGNQILDNLVISPRRSATICSDFQDVDWAGPDRPSVAGLWITNPNNTFIGNVVVGAQFGVWFTFPTKATAQTAYSDERGGFGGVFGASRTYFADVASGFGLDHWLMRQEQARTPTTFHNNTVKSSQRNGIFIDGLVTDSEDDEIPCLVGAGQDKEAEPKCGTCPRRIHLFSWAPSDFDINVEPSSRSYKLISQVFEDIVVAYTAAGVDDFSGPGNSFWASGGAVSFERAIFAFNERGTSLFNPADFCASHFYWDVAGYTSQWSNSLFIGSGAQRAIKYYDGGYILKNSRWAGLEYLVETRSVSKGQVNGLLLEQSGPLGWFDSDAGSDLFRWVMDSGRVPLTPRTATLPTLADWSHENLVGQWENVHLHLTTKDGFGDHLRSGFRQFIYSEAQRAVNGGWGPGVVEEASPTCRMFFKCGYTIWCGTGVDCEPGFGCKDLLPQ